MNGLHVQGMTQHAGDTLLRAESSQPVPGAETCYCHHEAVTRRCHGVEQWFRRRVHVAVHQDFPGMVDDTDVHAPGMQVDAAVIWVWVGVASPEVSSSAVRGLSQCQHTTGDMLRGETSISIKALHPTAYSFAPSFLGRYASGGGRA